MHLVDEVARHLAEHGTDCRVMSGGYDGSHSAQIVERSEMTHDRYFAELEAYLAAKRSAGQTGARE